MFHAFEHVRRSGLLLADLTPEYGLSSNPTIRSSTRRACWALTSSYQWFGETVRLFLNRRFGDLMKNKCLRCVLGSRSSTSGQVPADAFSSRSSSDASQTSSAFFGKCPELFSPPVPFPPVRYTLVLKLFFDIITHIVLLQVANMTITTSHIKSFPGCLQWSLLWAETPTISKFFWPCKSSFSNTSH